MKLSELRVCDGCSEPLVRPPVNWFWVARVCGAMVTAKASQVLSLTQMVGGALQLAETMSPEPEVVVVTGDLDPRLQTELLLCANCYTGRRSLAELVEMRNRATNPPDTGPEAA